MTKQTLLTLPQLRLLVEAGAVQAAELVGVPGGWTVHVQTGLGRRGLAPKAAAHTLRLFTTADTALRVLRTLGVVRVQVDSRHHADEAVAVR